MINMMSPPNKSRLANLTSSPRATATDEHRVLNQTLTNICQFFYLH